MSAGRDLFYKIQIDEMGASSKLDLYETYVANPKFEFAALELDDVSFNELIYLSSIDNRLALIASKLDEILDELQED